LDALNGTPCNGGGGVLNVSYGNPGDGCVAPVSVTCVEAELIFGVLNDQVFPVSVEAPGLNFPGIVAPEGGSAQTITDLPLGTSVDIVLDPTGLTYHWAGGGCTGNTSNTCTVTLNTTGDTTERVTVS
jgi:hypothetical protein